MLNGLSDHCCDARHVGENFVNTIAHFFLGFTGCDGDLDFRTAGRLGVFITLRATGAAGHALHALDLGETPFYTSSHAIGFIQRRSRWREEKDGERPFIE